MPKVAPIFIFFFVGLFFVAGIQAQNTSPYHLSLKREVLYSGSGIVSTISAWHLRQNIRPTTFGALIKPDLPDIDEFEFFDKKLKITFQPKSAGDLSDLTLYVSAGLSALFLSHKNTRQDAGTIGLLYLETMLINQGLTDIAKYTSLRPRPYVWTSGLSADQLLTENDRASFFSGHTSASAAASFFVARVFADYFPNSRLKPYVWGVAATLPALTGYLRVKAGKHYPTDVLVGYIVGGAIGYLVPTLHKRPVAQRRLKVSPGLSDVQINLQF